MLIPLQDRLSVLWNKVERNMCIYRHQKLAKNGLENIGMSDICKNPILCIPTSLLKNAYRHIEQVHN